MASPPPPRKVPKFYLVIHNIQKPTNVKNILCTAAAFGCNGVFVVGQKNFNLDPAGPDIPRSIKEFVTNEQQQQKQQHQGGMFLRRFEKWAEFVQYVQQESICMMGVEIHKDAKSVDQYLNDNNTSSKVDTAFLMGNEGQGLSEKQQEDCDGFVRIPQYGNGTASLNVNVAASIVLQRVYQWQMEEGY